MTDALEAASEKERQDLLLLQIRYGALEDELADVRHDLLGSQDDYTAMESDYVILHDELAVVESSLQDMTELRDTYFDALSELKYLQDTEGVSFAVGKAIDSAGLT